MEDFSIQVEKVTGQASDTVVCSVFSARVSMANSNVGTLVSCILVKGEIGDIGETQKNIFEIAQKKLESADGRILASLESATSAIKSYGQELEINLVHTFFFDNACYVSRAGDGVKLFVFDPPKSVEIKFKSGSGPISSGQTYLIATEAFLSIFDTSVLAQDAEVDFAGITDEVARDIAGEENRNEVGAAFISVNNGLEREKREDAEEGEREAEVEEAKEGEKNEEVNEEEGREAGEESGEREIPEPRPEARRANFLALLLVKAQGELGRLRRGDIGAIRRNIVTIAIIAVLVLAASGFYSFYQKGEREKLAKFNEYMTTASSKFGEGVAIIELNKSRARDILVEAEREVNLALEIKPDDEKARGLAADITQKLKETEVTSNVDFGEVADLGDSIKSLGFSGNNIIGISGSKLFTVNPATGDSTDVETAGGVDSGYVFDNKAFVISSNKVSRVDIVGGDEVEVGGKEGGLDIAVFSGNVYVLAKNSIAKFIPIEGGYSQETEYLNSAQEFASKSRFAIDGSIWVTAGNQVYKFTRGEKEDFEISGLVGGVGEFGIIYTNAALDNLYIVDTTNSALLVVSKDGVYEKVLQSSEFGRATDVVVDEEESKIYLSTGSKILEATL
jgi:hypothetical protein